MARRQTLGKKRKTRKIVNNKRRKTYRKMRRMRGGGRLEELKKKLEDADIKMELALINHNSRIAFQPRWTLEQRRAIQHDFFTAKNAAIEAYEKAKLDLENATKKEEEEE